MAAVFRKWFRSSSAKLENNREKNGEITGSPKQGGTRRLLARACGSVQNYRDSIKVSPAETNNGVLQSFKKMAKRNGNHSGNGDTGDRRGSAGSSTNSNGGGGGSSGGSNGNDSGTSLLKPKKNNAAAVFNETSAAHAKLVRTKRLMKEFQDIHKRQDDGSVPNFVVELVNDNMYEWNIKLLTVDSDSELARDMKETNTPYILLNMCFPDNFPFSPPFMRVISPKIEKGFVMEGGAICMELLTPGGWASAYTVEAILMQFCASLVKGQGRIAKKAKSGKDFNKKSAEASFRSLVKTHDKYGWVTPPLADG